MRNVSPPGMPSSDSTGGRARPRWLLVVACLLALLVVASGIFTAVHIRTPGPQPGVPGATPTAGTLPPNLSASQLYLAITGRKPSLVDPLDGSRQPVLWDEGPGCQFRQQAFSLTATRDRPVVICFLRNVFVGDFALQVQVTFGPTTSLGEQQGCALLFRTHLVQQEGFAFNLNTYARIDPLKHAVSTLQNASLDLLAPGNPSELKSWSQGLPDRLDVPNTLTVIAIGSQITLYINAQPQATISSSALRAGQIGLVSNSSFDLFRGVFTVAFRQLKLWILA